jgi:hypothetical protein
VQPEEHRLARSAEEVFLAVGGHGIPRDDLVMLDAPLPIEGVLMNTRWLSLLPAPLLAIAIASPIALAGPTNVPLRGSLATHETLELFPADGVCAGSFAKGTTAVIGAASQLGRVSGRGTDCINIVGGSPNLPVFAFANGELTLTAANGDQLTVTYSGAFTPTTNDPTNPQAAIYAITGTFQVTGGTGRFANATGQGVLNGSENTRTFQGHLELTGTISY